MVCELPIAGLVSVIVPAYNAGRYLVETLDSLLAQTYSPIEIIVVDDGSNDETPEICAAFADRIRYLRQQNQGVSAARNSGLLASRGEFIAFFDADDFMFPCSVSMRMEAINQSPQADIVYTDIQLVDSERRPLRISRGAPMEEPALLSLLKSPCMGITTVLFRRCCFAHGGLFDPQLTQFEDWDLYIRCASLRFKHLPLVTAEYRQHTANATRAWDRTLRQGIEMLGRHRRLCRDHSARAAMNEGLFSIYRHWLWSLWDQPIPVSARLLQIARRAPRYPRLAPAFGVLAWASVRKHAVTHRADAGAAFQTVHSDCGAEQK